MDDKYREEWIDLAKVITMLLVVIGHSSYYNINSYFGGIQYESNDVNHCISYQSINLFVNFIYTFHMPFFMAISGMTYAISYKPSATLLSIAKKKTIRLLIPMLLVTIFLSIPLKYFSGYWHNSSNIVSDIFLGQILLFGNTHLWFLASLFLITIVFTFCYRKKWIKIKSILFWFFLVIISYAGIFLSSRGAYFGIPGAMKNFIFFTSGFCFYDKIRLYPTNISKLLFGWICMICFYIVSVVVSFQVSRFQNMVYVPMAFLGCYNMVVTTKYLIKKYKITNSNIYKSLNKNSYDIYLYSDPFNYVLILGLFLVFDNKVFEGTLESILSFIIRIIFTIILAYMVVVFVRRVAKPSISKLKSLNRIDK